MTPIRKKLIDLRSCLDKILEAPIESSTNIKAQVTQSLVMDKDGAEALAALSRDIDGNVFLVQAAQINAQVIRHSAAALRHVTEIERCFLEDGNTLDNVLDDLLKKGWRLPEIEQMVRDKCFDIMERNIKFQRADGTLKISEIAKKLGLKRTTYSEQKKRLIKDG